MKTKDFIIFIFFVIFLLSLYAFFPVSGVFQKITTLLIFFAVIPILFNKLFLKKSLGEIGLGIGDWKQGLFWAGISTIIIGIILLLGIFFFGFYERYPIPDVIVGSYKNFLFYSLTTVLFFVVVYDFFFRGFLMMTLGLKIGWRAILVQTVIFALLVAFIGNIIWALVPYMIFAPFAGIIVYKSGSIIYSSIMQFIILIILNAGMVHILK